MSEDKALNNKQLGGGRIEWIDLAKGFCIILVVLNHCEVRVDLLDYLRMPFYFLLSGIFFKNYGNFVNLVKMKTNKLLIPYLFFSLLGLLIYMFKAMIRNYFNLNEIIEQMVIRFDYYDGPIWFLLCLFWCHVIYFFIDKINNKTIKNILVILLTVTGFVLWKYDIQHYLRLSTALVALPYFHIGYIMRRKGCLQYQLKTKYKLMISALAVLLPAILIYYFGFSGKVIFSSAETTGIFVLYYLYSFSLIVSLLSLCSMIHRLPVVSYCGRYSIVILAVHMVILNRIPFVYVLQRMNVIYPDIVISLLVLTSSIALIPMFIKYLPYVTAQKNCIKVS